MNTLIFMMEKEFEGRPPFPPETSFFPPTSFIGLFSQEQVMLGYVSPRLSQAGPSNVTNWLSARDF